MKKLRIIALTVLIGALGTASTWAQLTSYRIVNGLGAGFIVNGNGGVITNSPFGSEQGFIALGHFDDCECTAHDGHYHGTLAGIEDPDPNGCGWGCVDRVPANLSQAIDNLDDALDEIAGFSPELADKLDMILASGIEAAATDCASLFTAIANAMSEEVFGARANQQVTEQQIDNLLDAFMSWVNRSLDAMPLIEPTNNPCCKISLVRRKASAAQTKFFDAKRKINADVGEVIVLDVDACPKGAPISWEYQFKGEAKGDLPSGTGISFTPERFCVVAERATSVKITVT